MFISLGFIENYKQYKRLNKYFYLKFISVVELFVNENYLDEVMIQNYKK